MQRQAIQRQVIQRAESESESAYEQESSISSEDMHDAAGCEEDNCIDSDCDVKDSYSTTTGLPRPLGQTIRARFYPSFTTATQNWAAGRLNALQGNCGATQYRCEHCNQCVLKSNASLDHVTPVATHWNTVGYNTDQNTRFQWYNDTTNIEIVDRHHNSSMGSGGVYYRRDTGTNFLGGPNC